MKNNDNRNSTGSRKPHGNIVFVFAAGWLGAMSSMPAMAACPAPGDAVVRATGGLHCTWTPSSPTINSTLGWTYQVQVGVPHTNMGGQGLNTLDVVGDLTYNITPSGTGIDNWGVYVNAPDDSTPTSSYTGSSYMKVGNFTLNMNTPSSGNPVANVKSTGIWVDTNGWFVGNNVTVNISHLLNTASSGFESYGVLVGGAVNAGNYNPDFMAHAQFENLTISMKALTSGLGALTGTTMAGIRAIAQSQVSGNGYNSGSGTVVVNGMTRITTSGNYSLGVYVSGRNSLVDLNDSSITTSGNNSSAIKLGKYRAAGTGSGQFISRGHMELDTTAAAASSILLIGDVDPATSPYPVTTLNADFDTSSTVIKSGREAVNYSITDLTQSGSANGITASFNNAVMTSSSATASLIKVEGNATNAQRNAVFNLRGSGSSLTAPGNGWLFEVQNYASLTANVREGVMTGLTTVGGANGAFTLNLSDDAVWRLAQKGASGVDATLSTLNLASGATLDASAGPDFRIIGAVSNSGGTIDLAGAHTDAGRTLRIQGDYVGNGGRLKLNTVLGDDSSPSDKLVFDGGHASGTTGILVNNVGGLGALTTGDGILVVGTENGATTDSGAFTLGQRVAAGAYEYSLVRGGTSSAQNWYLISDLIPNPPPPPGPPSPSYPDTPDYPNYRPEVPVDMAALLLANRLGLAQLGTYHDRVGEEYFTPAAPSDSAKRTIGWARVFGETGSVGNDGNGLVARLNQFQKDGPAYDYNLGGFQAGLDLYRSRNAERATGDMAGVHVGAGHADSDVQAVYGGKAGTMSLNAYSIGAYWTRKADAGWYLDAIGQLTAFDNARGTSTLGQRLSTSGWGAAASIEGGYPFALGAGWAVEPQAQLIYQRVSLDDSNDAYGRMAFRDTNTVYGRIGARLTKSWEQASGRPLTAWARVNLWHAFGDDAETSFSNIYGAYPVTLASRLGGSSWAQMGLGVSAQIAPNTSLFATGDYNYTIGGGKGHGLAGRVGVKFVW